MKKLFFLSAAALTFALCGCTKDPVIDVDETLFNVPAEGASYTVNLKANTAWVAEITAESTATLAVEPEFGEGNAQVTITVAENLQVTTLAAVVRFTSATVSNSAIAEVTLSQARLETVSWGGVDYPVKKLADGNFWFVENLRYVPEGKEVSKDLTALDNGVWYPVDAATKTLTDNADSVARKGYPYSAEAALGLAPKTVNNDNYAGYEGAQGICPSGWHIPTLDEIANLVGRVAASKYDLKGDPGPVVTAPYWSVEAGAAQTAIANADGFNISNTNGYINAAATATQGTVLNVMTYILSSTGVPSSKAGHEGEFNNQFYGIMVAATLGGSCNGAAFNYRGGAAVRCIKTKLSGTPL